MHGMGSLNCLPHGSKRIIEFKVHMYSVCTCRNPKQKHICQLHTGACCEQIIDHHFENFTTAVYNVAVAMY